MSHLPADADADADVPHIEDAARVFLCIKTLAGARTIGCALFDRDANAMSLTEAHLNDDDDDDFLRLVMATAMADVIYCTPHAKPAIDTMRARESASNAAHVVVVPVKEFPARSNAADALRALGGFADRDVLGASIDVSEEFALSAAGALTRVLSLNAAIALELHGTPVRIQQFLVERYAHVDRETLCAIGIFVPLEFRRVSASCGTFSKDIFELFNTTTTSGGGRLLETWFRRPLRDVDVIGERLDCVEHFTRSGVVERLRARLTSKLDCHSLLIKMASDVRDASKSKSDWRRIIAHLDAIETFHDALLNEAYAGVGIHTAPMAIQDFIECASVRVPRLRKIIDAVVRVDEIYELMHDDDADSPGVSYVSYVRHGACRELDELRAMYHGLPDLLRKVRDAELERVPRFLRNRVVDETIELKYLPQIGFLVKCEGRLPEAYANELGYVQAFDRGDATFYEAECGVRIRDEIGDILTAIMECQESVLNELRQEIVAHSTLLRDIERCVSEIDALVALAEAAQTHALVRPTLVDDDELHVEGARHPLYEAFIDHQFIPHNISMPSDRERVVVLTGPNGSGKTVVLQTVGLITFLAHVGSFVPAKRATIGLTDRIFSRMVSFAPEKVGTEQDNEECAFTHELNQMARMMNNGTGRSLCLIDEFGTTTESEDGMCLLAAMIYHLATLKYPPKCLFTTHFREVCDDTIVPRVEQIAYRRMRIIMKPPAPATGMTDGRESVNIVFLYQYEDGVSDDSLALETCKLVGMPQEVIDRIKELKERDEAIRRGEEVPALEPVADPHQEYKFRVCEALVNRYNACKADPTDDNLDDFIEFYHSLGIDEYMDIKTDTLDERFVGPETTHG